MISCVEARSGDDDLITATNPGLEPNVNSQVMVLVSNLMIYTVLEYSCHPKRSTNDNIINTISSTNVRIHFDDQVDRVNVVFLVSYVRIKQIREKKENIIVFD